MFYLPFFDLKIKSILIKNIFVSVTFLVESGFFFVSKLSVLIRKKEKKEYFLNIWGGRIRTSEWRDQNPLPYHLATSHFNFPVYYEFTTKSSFCSSVVFSFSAVSPDLYHVVFQSKMLRSRTVKNLSILFSRV